MKFFFSLPDTPIHSKFIFQIITIAINLLSLIEININHTYYFKMKLINDGSKHWAYIAL